MADNEKLKKNKYWLKRPKRSPPKNEFWTKTQMIQNLIFVILIFENIISGIQTFYSRLHLTKDIIRKSQSQQKLTTKITHFKIPFRSKNLTHFTNLNSIDIENNKLPKLNQKRFSLYTFCSKHISVLCQKNYLHCTISWCPRTAFLKYWWDGVWGKAE